MAEPSIAERIYVLGLKNSLQLLRFFGEEPGSVVAYAHLEETTALPKSSLSRALEQLLRAGVIKHSDAEPIIDSHTHRPRYRFLELTPEGRYLRDHLDLLSEKIEGILGVLGYGNLHRNVRGHEYYIRLAVVKALQSSDGGLTREELRKALRKPRSFLATLTKQMHAMWRVIGERASRENPRRKLYLIEPSLTALNDRERDHFMKNLNYLLMLTSAVEMKDLLTMIKGRARL